MNSLFKRHPENPIVQPGLFDWRRAVTFNPAVIFENGKYWMFERCAGSLRPFICHIGGLVSDDGIHFTHYSDQPVFTPEMCGSPIGSVQDPRVVSLEGRYWMTFAYRPYAWSSHPTAIGVPESRETDFPHLPPLPETDDSVGSSNVSGGRSDNLTRSGLAVSDNLADWKFHSWITRPELDDRNVILFPEKIDGRYAVLRRPLNAAGTSQAGTGSHIWISYSDDMRNWTKPKFVARGIFPWETNRIGASTPPIKTEDGWLLFYHGVEDEDASVKRVIYRMGALLIDLKDPSKVIARLPDPLLSPKTYYEKVGAYIPNVVFPTACIQRDDKLMLYYGVCDTAICLATADRAAVMALLKQYTIES